MLDKIFTKKNLKILELISIKKLHIRDIAEKVKCSPGQVYKTVQLFKKFDFVKEKKVKNRKIILLNVNNPLLQKTRSLINLYNLINSRAYKELKKFGTTGIYGSFAKGTNTPKSDIDLWIYTEKSELKLREPIRRLEKELKATINLLTLNKRKIKYLKTKDPEFYIRLKLTSISLDGDIFD